jgi:F0F1-type ATP synthase assembly protein I
LKSAAILGQVGIVVAVPIALGAWLGLKLDEAIGTEPWGLLALIFAGMIVAGAGVWGLIKRHSDANPIRPSSDRAREAGRRWEAEIRERERRREAGEDEQ